MPPAAMSNSVLAVDDYAIIYHKRHPALPTCSQPHPCSSHVRFNAPSTTPTQWPSLTERITGCRWHGRWNFQWYRGECAIVHVLPMRSTKCKQISWLLTWLISPPPPSPRHLRQFLCQARICALNYRDVKVSRPLFFGLSLGLTVIGLGLGLMMYWSRVSYVLVLWSQSNHLLS